ncbi:MAG: hypothetical protein BWY98_01113 [Tenericutes bacterium ADurb.BinA155]|nr:MAG: hypothetical protein BWY98_01113 [Tenericutes bacterium ADurb.BinA155]
MVARPSGRGVERLNVDLHLGGDRHLLLKRTRGAHRGRTCAFIGEISQGIAAKATHEFAVDVIGEDIFAVLGENARSGQTLNEFSDRGAIGIEEIDLADIPDAHRAVDQGLEVLAFLGPIGNVAEGNLVHLIGRPDFEGIRSIRGQILEGVSAGTRAAIVLELIAAGFQDVIMAGAGAKGIRAFARRGDAGTGPGIRNQFALA